MSAVEVLRQAEELKVAVADTSRCANEVWVSRQALQDIYQKLLIIDLEFALDKKVEQDLWNHAFKKQISTLQNQAKEKQNQKRGEVQSSLNLFLEAASGFYLHLLQVICSAFKLDLPFRKKSSNYGIIQEYGPVMTKIRMPKRSSCMYICQDCLVHLGDIARYRQQINQAQVYYRHAAHLVPYNGQPYNQLAILEAAKGNKLSTVFFHIRSIAVKHPFLVAMTNLEKFYAKISKDSHEYRPKLTENELIGIFLQLHAFIHLCIDLAKAKLHADRILASLPGHILSNSFSSYQLVQMVAINLFSLYHYKRKLKNSLSQSAESKKADATNGNVELSSDGRKSKENAGLNLKMSFDLLFDITLSMFEVLLQSTPKDELKAKECHTLAPIKVLLDWLHTDPEFLSNPAFKTSSVWMNLSELLNDLQFFINQSETLNDLQRRMSTPLPEDCDLECFLPVNKAHSDLTYYSMSSETMTEEMEMRLRCRKLIRSGFWIAEEFPSLNLLDVQQLADGRLEFSTQIKPAQGSGGDHKTMRQNVAIQAILQKGNTKETVEKKRDVFNQFSRNTMAKNEGTDAKEPPEKLDAGVMAHALLGVGDSDRCSEKSFSSWSSLDRQFSSQGSAGSPGSSQSVSTETSYTREFHPVPMPSVGPSPAQPLPAQQPPAQQQMFSYYFPPPVRSSETQMMSQMPIHSSAALVQHQPGGVIGQRLMNPADRDDLLKTDAAAANANASLNGTGYTGPGKDGTTGHFDHLTAIYGQGIRGFVPREQVVPPLPQNQAFFRIGQPFSYGSTVGPQQQNVLPMYVARQEDASSRGMPMAMGLLPPQLQWSRQPVMPQRMPFVPYPSLNEPPPKLSDDFAPAGVRGTPLGFPQPLPTRLPPDPGILDGVNSQPMDRDGFLFAPGTGGRFPTPSPHLQSELLNGMNRISGMTFPPLGYGEIEDQSHPMGPQYGSHKGPGMYGVRNGGAQMSDFLDNVPVPVSPQPSGLFHAEKGILSELDLIQQSHDRKPNTEMNLSYPASSGIGMNFSCRTGDVMQPDSPQPIGARSQSSIFLSAGNSKKEQLPTSNTYSLFSQSPWPVGISKSADGNSHASSTFGSSNSSLRTTPDPDERSSVSSGGGYRVGLFSRPMTSSGNSGPWNTPSLGGNPLPATTLGAGGSLLSNNLQSLWNTGPSPLEKLLEQQKQQRQCEPR